MEKFIEISVDNIKPDRQGVLQTQGVPVGVPPSSKVKDLFDSAESIFYSIAAPIGIISNISKKDFGLIYSGEGLNEQNTPVEKIYQKADQLTFFAFTLGVQISDEIENQFNSGNLALGYMLDSIASYSADKASLFAQNYFLNTLYSSDVCNKKQVLLYSPGYCGWHISGQQKLFEYLKPEKIGIQLNKRFLMVPLKSISGALIAGERSIHKFLNNYPFCSVCKTKNCRSRMIIDK